MTSGRQLGFLVVGGAGGVGRSSHLPAILSHPLTRLAGVVDVNRRALEEVAAEYSCRVYTDLSKALQADDVDVVDICSPDFAHAEQALAAASAGKHILVEKPLALSMTEARAVRDAVTAAGVKAMVAQAMRFQPRWRSLREAILSGGVGKPVFGRFVVRGAFFSYPKGSFYRAPQSLGQIVHNGMHYFDTLAWLMDSPPAWVWAQGLEHYPADDRLPGPNYWHVQVGCASGALGHVEVNLALSEPPGVRREISCMIVGTEGTICSDGDQAALVERWDGQYTWPASWPPPGGQDAFAAEIGHFAQALLENRQPEISLDWSIRILEACLACLKALETGKRVALTHPVETSG